MHRRILRWSILGFFLALALAPGVASASDCPPDDPSRADCIAAASTARSPLVPIAGAAAGAGAAWVAGQALDPKTKDGTEDRNKETRADPCQRDLDMFNEASARAKALQAGLEGLRNMLTTLETMYQNMYEASYWSASVDVAMLGGAIWAKPAAGLLGAEIAEQTLAAKLGEAALKTFGQEFARGILTSMNSHGINWADVAVGKPIDSVRQTVLKESLSEAIVMKQMGNYAARGIDPKGPVGQALQRAVSTEVAGPLVDGLFGVISVYNLRKSALSALDKLKAIRDEMSKVRMNIFNAESAFEDAISDMQIARRTLAHCRKIWAQ